MMVGERVHDGGGLYSICFEYQNFIPAFCPFRTVRDAMDGNPQDIGTTTTSI